MNIRLTHEVGQRNNPQRNVLMARTVELKAPILLGPFKPKGSAISVMVIKSELQKLGADYSFIASTLRVVKDDGGEFDEYVQSLEDDGWERKT